MTKIEAINWVSEGLKKIGLEVDLINSDFERPWGAFWRIHKSSIQAFLDKYFSQAQNEANIDPKILLVEPGKKLSLQFHNRRREKWKIVNGPVRIIVEEIDKVYETDEIVVIGCKSKHRLIGLNNWGVVAEIWEHVDINNPSDENDIIRLDDDFGRKGIS